MFGLFKGEDPNRKILREEFESVTGLLRSADPMVQVVVGDAINKAYSLFRREFSEPSDFNKKPKHERIAYINKLTLVENKLRDEQGDIHASIGFGLFKMWVGALVEQDEKLMRQFSEELARLSKVGNIG